MFDRKLHRLPATPILAALVLTVGAVAGACSRGQEADHEASPADQAGVAAQQAGEGAAGGARATQSRAQREQRRASRPRVFFANVSDGDEVTSPVRLEFGIENFEIVPAQDPIVIEQGKGHHHLGVNTHCVRPGTIIEKAEPWIHFGDGSNTIDLQLPPGPIHLVLQVGDGEHRTLKQPGLCARIDLTVVE